MIPSISYPKNNLIEEALKGDKKSYIALARSFCLGSDGHDLFSVLKERLLHPEPADHPYFSKFCEALILARDPNTYKLAKQSIRELNQDSFIVKTMLIYIKVFSQKETSITQKFQVVIDETNKTEDCFLAIALREEYLEYIYNHSRNPEEVERGLQLQLSLIHEVRTMDCSRVFDVEESLIERQLKRYLSLIVKYFGGIESDTDMEIEAKKALIAAKGNHIAEYHLANLLLMNEFPKICDLRESYRLFINLLNTLDKESPYRVWSQFALILVKQDEEYGIDVQKDIRIPLAMMSNNNNASDLKAEILYCLAFSYVPYSSEKSTEFDIEKAYDYFNYVLKHATQSSYLIALSRYQLGCILLLKNGDRVQNLKEALYHFNELVKNKNLSNEHISAINFMLEISLGINFDDVETVKKILSRPQNQNKQMLFHALQDIASQNPRKLFVFLSNYKSLLHNIDLDKETCDFRIIAKNSIIDFFKTENQDNYRQLVLAISCYFNSKNKEISQRTTERADKLKFPLEIVKQDEYHASTKTKYEINCEEIANHLYEEIFSLEGDRKAEIYNNIDIYLDKYKNILDKILGTEKVFSTFAVIKQASFMVSVFNSLIKKIEEKNTYIVNKSCRSLLLDLRCAIVNNIHYYLDKTSKLKIDQNNFFFFMKLYTLLSNQTKFLIYNDNNTSNIAYFYYTLSSSVKKLKNKHAAKLLFESGHLNYCNFLYFKNSSSDLEVVKRNFINDYAIGVCLVGADLYKYDSVCKEILDFGPMLIKEYINKCCSHINGQNKLLSYELSVICLTSINLLRFYNREDEADEIIEYSKNYIQGFSLSTQAKKDDGKYRSSNIGRFEAKRFNKFDLVISPGLLKKMNETDDLSWIPSFDLTLEISVKREINQPKKIKKETQVTNTEKKEEVPVDEFYIIESTSSSATKETKERAKELFENQERKQHIKEKRVPKHVLPISEQSFIKQGPCNSQENSSPIKFYLSPSCKTIFDKLWELNSGALNNPHLFDPHDYHNDIVLTKREVKKLIEEGLGGQYLEEGGKGSHEKGIIPSICLNNKTMTFANFDSPTSQNVTLTKSSDLKPYQISQLRDKLIKSGYTPNRVELLESKEMKENKELKQS